MALDTLSPLLHSLEAAVYINTSWLSERLTIVVAALFLPLLLTYCLTSFRAYWALTAWGDKGQPPQVPYAVPLLGNTLSFAFGTESFLAQCLQRFGQAPFRFLAGPEKIYYVPYGEPVLAMFRNARDLVMKPIVIVAMRDQFGMPPADLAIYERDGSGGNVKPLEGWEHMDPAHRIFHNQHRDLNFFLNGAALDGLSARFIDNMAARLRNNPVIPQKETGQWVEVPDLYAFFRNDMFHAAVEAIVGERFFALCPTFADDFWAFDNNVLTYLRRLPRWMAPAAYAARDRLLAAIKRWRTAAAELVDPCDPALATIDYEPVWGARLMRARAAMFAGAGASPDGCASMDLGLLWAASANAIPAAMWALLHVALSPQLIERARAEAFASFREDGSLDVASLCSKPLLTGLYLESLRFCAATASARHPVTDDFRLAGWRVPRDCLMLSISWFGGHDVTFWNTGRRITPASFSSPSSSWRTVFSSKTQDLPHHQHYHQQEYDEHPVDEFWAERFLEYPDDPLSGPVKRADPTLYRATTPSTTRTVEDDKLARPITSTPALKGHFYPYGGGSRVCPGRHLAKQEILSALALVLREWDVEILDAQDAKAAKPDMRAFPTGAMPPDRTIRARVRRRVVR